MWLRIRGCMCRQLFHFFFFPLYNLPCLCWGKVVIKWMSSTQLYCSIFQSLRASMAEKILPYSGWLGFVAVSFSFPELLRSDLGSHGLAGWRAPSVLTRTKYSSLHQEEDKPGERGRGINTEYPQFQLESQARLGFFFFLCIYIFILGNKTGNSLWARSLYKLCALVVLAHSGPSAFSVSHLVWLNHFRGHLLTFMVGIIVFPVQGAGTVFYILHSYFIYITQDLLKQPSCIRWLRITVPQPDIWLRGPHTPQENCSLEGIIACQTELSVSNAICVRLYNISPEAWQTAHCWVSQCLFSVSLHPTFWLVQWCFRTSFYEDF